MDEQRLAAYLELIQALLECPSGANDILNAHRELVDADFVQVMEAEAENMAAEGNSNASWLQNIVAQLKNSVGNTTTLEEYLSFLEKVLKATSDSDGNPQVVYPILKQNFDKLDLKFAQMLQDWATFKFADWATFKFLKVTSEQAASFAADIVNFGNLIQQFPLGRRAWNLEIGITCYTAALEVYTRDNYPEQWAMTQNNLGLAYIHRIEGVRAQNIEEAICCCLEALKVYTREANPENWAMIQNNLGGACRSRIEGVKAQNIEEALACFWEALKVRTREADPENWAMTQNNLGNAYRDRIEGVRADNIEEAIACVRQALEVYTCKAYPKQWAGTQNILGNAYRDRIEGVRADNIEEAIGCYRAALDVYTREVYPEDWARTQNNLGAAYSKRIEGLRAQNIEEAIACYLEALKVHTREVYPEQWAMTQNNLGTGYSDRIEGLRAQNIEEAIACYRAALDVYTREVYPEDWAMTQNNLAIAYNNRIEGVSRQNIEEALACCWEALKVCTRDNYPEQWARTQNNLGAAYSDRIEGLRAQNIEEAIACYRAALDVYTREVYPEDWAMTQNNLAIAYINRIKGVRATNIEEAIAYVREALEVYTRENYPEQWAMTQGNLGNAYSNRIEGVRRQNIEEAIAYYREALNVYTRDNYPEQWAMIQNALGSAYSYRIEGVSATNIEEAIACYTAALKVRTCENYPEKWAETQNNLGNAYRDRIKGVRATNIEEAISYFRESLEVYTRDNYPQKWAMTQNNLGIAYRNRIEGVRAVNTEEAIACYREASKVCTSDNYPENWAMTQNNLGIAYSYRIAGVRAENIELAISCFRLALEIHTPIAFPLDCLTTGRNLGNTAFTAGFWDIALEGFDKAIQAVEKSRSWATSDDIRQQMIAESIGVYEKAIQAAVNNNQLEKAIEYCDRTRAQRLVDLMHSNDLYAGEIPPAVQKYLREFEAKQHEIDAEVEQSHKQSEGNKGLVGARSQSRTRADTSAYTDKIQELEAQKQQIWENIRSLDPVLAGQVQVDPMQFAAIQQLIDNSQTAILCFYTTDDDTHVFVIYKDKAPQIHTCHGEGWGNFQQWIDESWLSPYLKDKTVWRQGMGEFLSQLSRRLKVDELIGNCLEGIQELIVIPHLYLHQIPLAALPVEPPQPPLAKGGLKSEISSLAVEEEPPNPPLLRGLKSEISSLAVEEEPPQPPLAKGGLKTIEPHLAKGGLKNQDSALTKEEKPLLSPPLSKGGPGGVLSDYFLIRYIPSCRILEYCSQRPTIKSLKYGIVENATDDLLFTSFECQQVAKIVTVKQRLKGSKEATVAEYRNMVKSINGLHSSHHAKSDLKNPLKSHLLLGDGNITLGELMTPGWRMPELSDVFLSCCETNLGVTEITDDILSLGTGFLCAGARSVVSTLWEVHQVTGLFSIFYYQYRQKGLSRPEALSCFAFKL